MCTDKTLGGLGSDTAFSRAGYAARSDETPAVQRATTRRGCNIRSTSNGFVVTGSEVSVIRAGMVDRERTEEYSATQLMQAMSAVTDFMLNGKFPA